MEVVIILLYIFLIIIGAISIIGSITALSKNNPSESDSQIETKWFKWKAPVRLIFGLLCIMAVIFINKFDFYEVDKERLKEMGRTIEKLNYENEYLKEKLQINDSIQTTYLLTLEHETGKSIFQGRILISNFRRTMKIKGGSLYSEEFKLIEDNESRTQTGDKFYVEFHNEIWGINVFESQVNETTIKIEVYKESELINDKIIRAKK